jgi:hypothetical protein
LTAFAFVASKDLTVAPNRGGCATTAVSMPGRCTSWVKIALPLVLSGESLRGARLPMSLKSLGSLSRTSAGTPSRAAAFASWPKLAWRLEAECITAPSLTLTSSSGTFHCFAAAATSMARAEAPALRSCSHELAIAVLPPVPCVGPQNRLL